MQIYFYIPKDQIIPTVFRLKVDDADVYYEKIENGYRFEVYEQSADKAKAIVDAVIEQIIIDHDESQHGVSWRTVSLEEVESNTEFTHIYEWRYRIRDSY